MKKYTSEDYPFLKEDLDWYYTALDKYQEDKTKQNFYDAEHELRGLFFSLKAHKASGHLSPIQFEEMLEYFKGELYGYD